jgi:23S rRNA (cytosine1962-C5)-methyltransferase
VARVSGDPKPGDKVEVLSAAGGFLARAGYSPVSQIRARVWTFDVAEPVDADFFRRRIRAAILLRLSLDLSSATNAYRLVHAESDDLPGLIVDRYDGVLVVQFMTAGIDPWREAIIDILRRETGLDTICERSDGDARALEGLAPRSGMIRGGAPGGVSITENRLSFQVDPVGGPKTGFYLDQRDNRLLLRRMAKDKEVLDCFCFSGGFAVNALAGGARSVLAVDSSAEALALARKNLLMNDMPEERAALRQGDVFRLLREFRDEDRRFDLIVLDPPKFAPTAAQAQRAARGYKDINLLAFKLLKPGGILFTFSCSAGVDTALFGKIIAGAALDAGTDARILAHMRQGPDHPVSSRFPEGAYLKGLVCLRPF